MKYTDKENQTAFLWDWWGATGKKVLESHKWSEADEESAVTSFDKLEQTCHPTSNKTLYKNLLRRKYLFINCIRTIFVNR